MSTLFKKLLGFLEKNKLLLLVLVLAAALRLTFLTYAPPALNWDEVSHGYNAYSILKTAKDEWGRYLPLSNFRAYGDYPLALNLYLTIPFIAIFGLSELSIRLPHAILGVFSVLATYFLAWGLTRSKKISILAALLMAIEPWALFLSRFVVQSNLSVFFLTASLAAFFNRQKSVYLLPLSLLALGLTLYSYHTTRIVTPIILILGFLIYKKSLWEVFKKFQRVKFMSLTIMVIFFIPFLFLLSKPEASARSRFTFIINEGAVAKIIEKRNESELPETLERLLYNRPTYFLSKFVPNYVNYFSYKFLFTEGGTQYQFSVPGKGLLYPASLAFFYLGLYIIAKKALKGEGDFRLLLIWLIISPIPAAITTEANAVVRASAMLPLPMIACSMGFSEALSWAKDKFKLSSSIGLYVIYLVALALFAGNYLKTYFTDYRRDYSWSWQYGYKEAVTFAKENYEYYDKIIVTKKYGEPHEFFLFFLPWDPGDYQESSNLIRYYQSGWYWVDRFDKFFFVNDWEIPKGQGVFVLESKKESIDCTKEVRCLLITSPDNHPEGWRKLETIYFLDGEAAFEIYEN